MPGSGDCVVNHIFILDSANHTLVEDQNRTNLHVGEEMPLRVMATWAIPLVEEETPKASLTVDKPEYGRIETGGVFKALSPGEVTITATLRVAQRPYQEVLAPGDPGGPEPTRTHTNTMRLTIVP
jgi:hypothetical protein